MFFLVVTVIASLNDYWQLLRLDVLLADPTMTAQEPAPEESVEDDALPRNDVDKDAAVGETDGEVEATANGDGDGGDVVDGKTSEADDSGRKCETCNEDHGSPSHRIESPPHKKCSSTS